MSKFKYLLNRALSLLFMKILLCVVTTSYTYVLTSRVGFQTLLFICVVKYEKLLETKWQQFEVDQLQDIIFGCTPCKYIDGTVCNFFYLFIDNLRCLLRETTTRSELWIVVTWKKMVHTITSLVLEMVVLNYYFLVAEKSCQKKCTAVSRILFPLMSFLINEVFHQ